MCRSLYMWQSHLCSLPTQFWSFISMVVFNWILMTAVLFSSNMAQFNLKLNLLKYELCKQPFGKYVFSAGVEILVTPRMGVLHHGHLWHKLPTGQAQLLLENTCWISERWTWKCSYLYNHQAILWGIPHY